MLQFLPIHSPLIVDIRDAIIAGSTGRMAMILLIYFGPYIGLPRIDAVGLLGSLVAPDKETAVTLGGAIHFSVGIVFAIIYVVLWSVGVGSATWYWGIIFGFVHGLLLLSFLIVLMRVFPPLTSYFNKPSVMLAVLLNHVVYGLVVAVVYTT